MFRTQSFIQIRIYGINIILLHAKEKKAFGEGKRNILIDLMPKIEICGKYILRIFEIDQNNFLLEFKRIFWT